MAMRYEVRLSGEGGQGLILAGVILAEAVGIYDGKNVTQSQSYGPESRGGKSKSEVIISEQEIDYPKATRVDLLLSLTQESCNEYVKDLKEEGHLVVDATYVSSIPPGNFQVYQVPMIQIAREEIGKEIVANIVALGVITEISGIVTHEAIKKAVLARVPKGTEALNTRALEAGFAAGRTAVAAKA